MFTKSNSSKKILIENRSSSCQRWSLHGFQTSHFICDQFGSKLWLRSIQNHHGTPDIVSKLLRVAIWSRCAARFESEQTQKNSTGRISVVTNLAPNFGCYRFRIMPDIVSKLLRAAIWSRCAVLFESEQTSDRSST